MKKRILATLLAAMMLTSTAVVFAEEVNAPGESGTYGSATDYTGTTMVPTIKVTVPTTGAIIINPYGMDADGEGDTSEVVSAATVITNESDVAIAVDVTTTAALGTDSKLVLATAALKGTETTKSACLWVEANAAKDADGTLDGEATWSTAYSKAANQALIGTKATTVKGIAQMAAGNETATYAAFKVLGDVVAEPATPWTDKDTVNVKVAYTFVPQAAETVAP